MKFMAIAAIGLATTIVSNSAPAEAQGNPHLGHVAEQFGNTPDNVGLLAAAAMEAAVAAQHAELAARDLDNLAAIKRHTAHVLNALNPETHPSGPGKGYGLIKAAHGVVAHINLAAERDGASDNIKRHSSHVAASAGNVEQWSLAIMEHGETIMATEDVAVAAEHAKTIAAMTQHILNGHDANDDGSTGWQEGEGGLAQAERHLELLLQGEGTI